MPWDAIFAAVGTSSVTTVIFVVLILTFANSSIDRLVAISTKQLDNRLQRTEDLFHAALATGTSVDTDLRQQRIVVYKELWEITGVLPKWPRAQDITYGRIQAFSEALRDWYFTKGGIYLSEEAKNAYVAVQDSIWESETLKTVATNSLAQRIPDGYYDAIREKCSALRSEITADLLTRRGAPDIVA